jgi:YHS domain-containing protein
VLVASCTGTAGTPGDAAAKSGGGPGATVEHAQDKAERRGDAYYLSTCARCERTLGAVGPAVEVAYEQRSLRFCTQACCERFMADPAGGLAHVDAVMIHDQAPHYPVNTSIISGRPLGGPGGTGGVGVEFVWCNRLVRVADEAERQAFMQDPERYVRVLDEEVIRVQTPTYGMPMRCPVQGDILPSDEPIDFVVANRMVRVCCARCVRSVRARPYQYLTMVDYANREAAKERGEGGE